MTHETLIDPQQLAARYMDQWNVPDAAERRAAIERLRAEDGTHILHPPAEIRETAAELGFDHTTLEAQGFAFRARPGAIRLNGVVRIGWEVVSTTTGDVVGGGSDILVLDDNGRIEADYMVVPGSADQVLEHPGRSPPVLGTSSSASMPWTCTPSCGAVLVLRGPRRTVADRLEAGATLMRIWLELTEAGYAAQPLGGEFGRPAAGLGPDGDNEVLAVMRTGRATTTPLHQAARCRIEDSVRWARQTPAPDSHRSRLPQATPAPHH